MDDIETTDFCEGAEFGGPLYLKHSQSAAVETNRQVFLNEEIKEEELLPELNASPHSLNPFELAGEYVEEKDEQDLLMEGLGDELLLIQ